MKSLVKLVTICFIFSSFIALAQQSEGRAGGVTGNGATVLKIDGRVVPADIYLVSKAKNLPYSEEQKVDISSELRSELKYIVGFIDKRNSFIPVSRSVRQHEVETLNKHFLSLEIDDFRIYEVDKLSSFCSDSGQKDDIQGEQVACTYVRSVEDEKSVRVKMVRVIELHRDLFSGIQTNRERAMVLLHEMLHHVYADIYAKYSSSHFLITRLIKNLSVVLKAHDSQKTSRDNVELSQNVLEGVLKLNKIIVRYLNLQEKNTYISRGGGLSNQKAFAENNFIDLESSINVETNDKIAVGSMQNSFNNVGAVYLSLSNSAKCTGNVFDNFKSNSVHYPIAIECAASGAKVSGVSFHSMDLMSNYNSDRLVGRYLYVDLVDAKDGTLKIGTTRLRYLTVTKSVVRDSHVEVTESFGGNDITNSTAEGSKILGASLNNSRVSNSTLHNVEASGVDMDDSIFVRGPYKRKKMLVISQVGSGKEQVILSGVKLFVPSICEGKKGRYDRIQLLLSTDEYSYPQDTVIIKKCRLPKVEMPRSIKLSSSEKMLSRNDSMSLDGFLAKYPRYKISQNR